MRREKFANETADVESTEADKDSVLSMGEYLAQFLYVNKDNESRMVNNWKYFNVERDKKLIC